MTPQSEASRSASRLRELSGVERVEAGIVLGSGWAEALVDWPEPVFRCPLQEITGFLAPTAVGHRGEALIYRLDQPARGHQEPCHVLVLSGRTHLYEGHGVASVAHGVRALAAYGAERVILTNANGSLRGTDWPLGSAMLIRDHLNLTGVSPLEGPDFVDLTQAWSPRLRAVAHASEPTLVEGTYAQLRGPHYNTFAEADWLRRIGADAVGMSTVLEAIAARAAGLEVVGLSLVSAIEGSHDQPSPSAGEIDPDEVVAAAADTARRLSGVLAALASAAS